MTVELNRSRDGFRIVIGADVGYTEWTPLPSPLSSTPPCKYHSTIAETLLYLAGREPFRDPKSFSHARCSLSDLSPSSFLKSIALCSGMTSTRCFPCLVGWHSSSRLSSADSVPQPSTANSPDEISCTGCGKRPARAGQTFVLSRSGYVA